MDQQDSKVQQSQAEAKPEYTTPVVKTMTEAEVLSAFQVGATSPGMGWWAC